MATNKKSSEPGAEHPPPSYNTTDSSDVVPEKTPAAPAEQPVDLEAGCQAEIKRAIVIRLLNLCDRRVIRIFLLSVVLPLLTHVLVRELVMRDFEEGEAKENMSAAHHRDLAILWAAAVIELVILLTVSVLLIRFACRARPELLFSGGGISQYYREVLIAFSPLVIGAVVLLAASVLVIGRILIRHNWS